MDHAVPKMKPGHVGTLSTTVKLYACTPLSLRIIYQAMDQYTTCALDRF